MKACLEPICESPLVSVIVPVYNVAPFLPEALDSVLTQTWSNLEIIAVDDGSTDRSGEICDCYAQRDTRMRVIHQQNRGLSAARNTGLDTSRGDIIAFLDPDDAYQPEMVESLVHTMKVTGADIVVCRYSIHHARGLVPLDRIPASTRLRWADTGSYDRITALRALADGLVETAMWDKLYRRGLWQGIRFPEGHVYEGTATTYRLIDRCEKMYMVSDVLYAHRSSRPGSICNTNTMENRLDACFATIQWTRFVEENTPNVFTAEQLESSLKSRLSSLLFIYANRVTLKHCAYTNEAYIRSFGEWEDNSSYRLESREDSLRQCILSTGRDVRIDSCPVRVRVAWWMTLCCPKMLHFLYPIYRRLRHKADGILG